MSRHHSRGDIINPHDGMSRLTLGQAAVGERAKGTLDPVLIARQIRRLYDRAWLTRELAKPRANHPKGDHQVLDALLVLEDVQEAA